LPALNDEVLNWAVLPLKAMGPPAFDPSMTNWTVPVGVPAPGATTAIVAVKVTFSPGSDGFADELTLVVVPAWLTTWPPVRVPLLALKLASPLYCVSIE
jgi:hypothetical protein